MSRLGRRSFQIEPSRCDGFLGEVVEQFNLLSELIVAYVPNRSIAMALESEKATAQVCDGMVGLRLGIGRRVESEVQKSSPKTFIKDALHEMPRFKHGEARVLAGRSKRDPFKGPAGVCGIAESSVDHESDVDSNH